MKRSMRLCMALCCTLAWGTALSLPVFAESSLPEITLVEEYEAGPAEEEGVPLHPADISLAGEDGSRILKKTYLTEASVQPETLVEQGLVWQGCAYEYLDVLVEQLPDTVETKEVTQTAAAFSESGSLAEIAAAQDQELFYEKDGFTGTLTLDAAGIVVEEGERETYSYPVSDTREYPGLASNDPALVPDSILKDGVTLSLSGLRWQAEGVQPDGSGLPSSYTAEASYSGTAQGSRTGAYHVLLPYTGQVSRTTPGQVKYTLLYGEVPPQEEPSLLPGLLLGAGFLLLGGPAVATVAAVKRLPEKGEARDEEE